MGGGFEARQARPPHQTHLPAANGSTVSEATEYQIATRRSDNVLRKKVTDFKGQLVYYWEDQMDRLEKRSLELLAATSLTPISGCIKPKCSPPALAAAASRSRSRLTIAAGFAALLRVALRLGTGFVTGQTLKKARKHWLGTGVTGSHPWKAGLYPIQRPRSPQFMPAWGQAFPV